MFAPGGKEKDACCSGLSTSAGGVLAFSDILFGESAPRLVAKDKLVKPPNLTKY